MFRNVSSFKFDQFSILNRKELEKIAKFSHTRYDLTKSIDKFLTLWHG